MHPVISGDPLHPDGGAPTMSSSPGADSGAAPATDRIGGLDAARGFALFGILVVNVEFFFLPLADALGVGQPAATLERAVWWLQKVLFEGKFYPLFSLLFGIGMVLQRSSLTARGLSFTPIYLRRVVVLAAIGLVHAFLLWHGDILFFYSAAALLLMLAVGLGPRVLLGLGLVTWVLALSIGVVLAVFQPRVPLEPIGPIGHAPAGSTISVAELMTSEDVLDPQSLQFRAVETAAYRDGPWTSALAVRSLTFTLISASMLFGGGFHLLAMFFLGAAMAEAGMLTATGRSWWPRLLLIGFGVGLPMGVASIVAFAGVDGAIGAMIWQGLLLIGGPFLAVGYLAFWMIAWHRGWLSRCTRWLASAGRLALTHYLLQTVVCTFLAYHWGLGWFGQLDRPERVGVGLSLFAVQLVASVIWLEFYRFGPVEWVWRRLTYGRRGMLEAGRRASRPTGG